ncbi:DMT family transporter [Azospirillum rugosum]|uniref:Drug/metabolite transporter (DMT)-like permease n=1 Tax=Azospirillum rugosum TaxID=416170 RepID=A0ABS4SGD5_9PROT|nr:DMT family transporter [Azospirillum rugosum]MBP2291485.1 drug/metabolite transporter (DMT)-like permease [Azospirillum rugosum]MDQ0525273.1 drug/metabolite transporter (DMT)-like permease [Azospirillum rugosum]
MISRARALDLALVAMISVAWGLNWPAVKIVLSQIPPWTMRSISFVVAAAELFALAHWRGESLAVPRGERLPLVTAAMLNIAGFNILATFGQLNMATSGAAIIAYTMPAWGTLLAIPLLGERPGRRQWLGLLCGLAGLGVLLGPDLARLGALPLGPAFMLGAALSWALGSMVLKRTRWTIGPAAVIGWQFALSVPVTLPIALALEPAPTLALEPRVAVALAFHLLISMAGGYLLWFAILKRMSVAQATVSSLIVPVIGVSGAILLLGETPPLRTYVALALIVGAVLLVVLVGDRREPAAAGPVPEPQRAS